MCHLHTHLAQWEQAIEWCGKSIASGGATNWYPYVDLAAANAWAGHDKEAKETVAQLRKVYPDFTVQNMGRHPLERRSDIQRAISAHRRGPAQGRPAGRGEEDELRLRRATAAATLFRLTVFECAMWNEVSTEVWTP